MQVYKSFFCVAALTLLTACASGTNTEVTANTAAGIAAPASIAVPNLDGRADPAARVSASVLQPIGPTSAPQAPVPLLPQNSPQVASLSVDGASSNAPIRTLNIPPIPPDSAELRDGPECNYALQVQNQEFAFAPETVNLLRQTGARPWVFIRHDVNRSGQVMNPVVVRSAGIQEYDADAIRSLLRWQVTLPAGRTYLRGCMAKFAVR